MNLALFDLDGTLLPLDSDHAFGEFLVAQGWIDAAVFKARNDAFYADYLAERLDMQAYVQFTTSAWRSRPATDREAIRARFMHEVIGPRIEAQARALVDHHRDRGDTLAMVTATNEFVTRPIADAFGIGTLIATELATDGQGGYTGAICGVPCYREGKTHRVNAWLASRDESLDAYTSISVYSDSTNDLPLLECATDAVATNPSNKLEAIARQRGWRILRLFSP